MTHLRIVPDLLPPKPPVTSARPHGSETVPESALVAGIVWTADDAIKWARAARQVDMLAEVFGLGERA